MRTEEPVWKSLGIDRLNALQEEVCETARRASDLVVLSPTGSGKTLAYLLPLLDNLRPGTPGIQALILVPSRELALQVEEVFRRLATGHRVTACYGGHDIQVEIRSLETPPALLIATPGRLVDHLQRGTIRLNRVETVVVDEYDKMVELGFQEELQTIFLSLRGVRRRLLTSATRAGEIPAFLGMTAPEVIDYIPESEPLRLKVWQVPAGEDGIGETLFQLVCYLGETTMLVFCRFREESEELCSLLADGGIAADVYHGGLEQSDRERVLCKFRNGSLRVLVATDLAARGLDIPEVDSVIHYRLPEDPESYLHRNGRTARMGASGNVYLLCPDDNPLPDYIGRPEILQLPGHFHLPPPPEWETLYINRGKKEKLSKSDIVGFLCQKGGLTQADIGRIEVKDYHAFAAVRRELVKPLLARIRGEKIKGSKTLFYRCR